MKKKKRIAYSFVMADLLHYGHIKLLKTARDNADHHICGLISDESCHLWQGINICNYEERRAVLESLDCVDEVMKQESMDPTENLKKIHARDPQARLILVHGDDWKALPASDYLRRIGGSIIQPEYYSQLSRRNIVKKFSQSLKEHPLKHEFYNQHFRLGNIVQFSPQRVNSLISSKANTLKSFQALLKRAAIEKLFVFTAEEFRKHPRGVIREVQQQFGKEKIVIRSSSMNEDSYESSNAGCFESVLDVPAGDGGEIQRATRKIIASYRSKGSRNPGNQILVQTQTRDVVQSGVVFTRNVETNAPYYVINYDDSSGRSDTVTSGEFSRSVWLHKEARLSAYPAKWRKLISAVREIEEYLETMVLDIEFAVKKNGQIVIFQIRPLAANVTADQIDDVAFEALLDKTTRKYTIRKEKIEGGRAFLSDMAFWNPAELIGDNPHPLDTSVFREMVTRSAWNRGLVGLGYTECPHELMEIYGNKPYIVVDYAFFSLIPAELPRPLKLKLLRFYKEKLKKDFSAHDKVEFEIVLASLSFGGEKRFEELRQAGFSAGEVRKLGEVLRRLTVQMIDRYPKRLSGVRKSLGQLAAFRKKVERRTAQSRDARELVQVFMELLEKTEEFGTIPFAAVARQAFAASFLMQSLEDSGGVGPGQVGDFMQGIQTVASDFDRDFAVLLAGKGSGRSFLRKYGHLRSGTYDIRAPRYDEMPFLMRGKARKKGRGVEPHRAVRLDPKKIQEALRANGMEKIRPEAFLRFVRSAIQDRERVKFEFTRSLSLALRLLTRAGELLGIAREDLSFLDLPVLRGLSLYSDDVDLREFWLSTIESRKKKFADNEKIVLPPVIESKRDFKAANYFTARPNFITQKVVRGETVFLEDFRNTNLKGKIVVLEKADPGYDWIFARQIKGLVTKYGGVASHMAIRCAEFSVPAAIGCGENLYNRLKHKPGIVLDCQAKKVL